MKWFGPALMVVTAIAILVGRRDFAALQANVLGGSILPGCVVAEAIVLFVIALALYFIL